MRLSTLEPKSRANFGPILPGDQFYLPRNDSIYIRVLLNQAQRMSNLTPLSPSYLLASNKRADDFTYRPFYTAPQCASGYCDWTTNVPQIGYDYVAEGDKPKADQQDVSRNDRQVTLPNGESYVPNFLDLPISVVGHVEEDEQNSYHHEDETQPPRLTPCGLFQPVAFPAEGVTRLSRHSTASQLASEVSAEGGSYT